MRLSADFFRLLGDSQRLRMLRLLAREKLNVSELTQILGASQPGISRHLRLLKEANLVREDRDRGWAYYSVNPSDFTNGIAGLWPSLNEQLRDIEGSREDDVRLLEILRQRKEDFREKGTDVANPGRSWAAWARTLCYLAPRGVVADLGCGEGYLTLEVAKFAQKVIAVDRSKAMLKRGRALAQKQKTRNIRWKQGLIENLPIQNGQVDIVLMAQVLHSLEKPLRGLEEAYRILKPGGILIFQELRAHKEEWVKTKLGDKWLGFEEKELRGFLKKAKFIKVQVSIGSRRRGDPFTVLIGCGKKSARKS